MKIPITITIIFVTSISKSKNEVIFFSPAIHYKFQQTDRPWADKQWGLCIFDDVIEHAGPVSF